MLISSAAYTQRGPHHSSHGLPAYSVHATGSTTGKSRSTRVEPTRNGAHTNQSTDHPRAAYTEGGPHQSRQGLPTCSLHATEFRQVKSGVTHVSARYRVHASRSTDYPRGARATGSTQVHPRTTPASKGYIGSLNEHTYRSNYLV